jgi:hypothetical protein
MGHPSRSFWSGIHFSTRTGVTTRPCRTAISADRFSASNALSAALRQYSVLIDEFLALLPGPKQVVHRAKGLLAAIRVFLSSCPSMQRRTCGNHANWRLKNAVTLQLASLPRFPKDSRCERQATAVHSRLQQVNPESGSMCLTAEP